MEARHNELVAWISDYFLEPSYILWTVVLVIYCCIIKHCKCISLAKHPFIISQFPLVMGLGMAYLGPLCKVLQVAIEVSARLHSHLGLWLWEASASMLTAIVGRIHFLAVICSLIFMLGAGWGLLSTSPSGLSHVALFIVHKMAVSFFEDRRRIYVRKSPVSFKGFTLIKSGDSGEGPFWLTRNQQIWDLN